MPTTPEARAAALLVSAAVRPPRLRPLGHVIRHAPASLPRRSALAAAFALGAGGCLAKRTAGWASPPTPFGTVSDDILARPDRRRRKGLAGRAATPSSSTKRRAPIGAALRYSPADAGVLVHLARIAKRRATAAKGAGAAEHLNEATAYAERALAARNGQLARRGARRQEAG